MTESPRPPEPPSGSGSPPEPNAAPAMAPTDVAAGTQPPAAPAPPPASASSVAPPPPAPAQAVPAPPPAPPPALPVAPPPVGGYAPAPPPPAVAQAEQMARDTAAQVATRTRAWWGRLDPQGKRPTLIVAGVLALLVLGTQVLNGIIPTPGAGAVGGGGSIPGGGPNPGGGPTVGARPIDVGLGVRIYALAGWQQLESGGALQGIRLQKGSVVLDARVTQFGGDHTALLTAYVNQILQPDAQQLTVGQVTVVAGNGRTAARANYVGLFNGVTGSVEGELTAFVAPNGVAVIIDAWGAQGSLADALPEVHAMVDTIEVR